MCTGGAIATSADNAPSKTELWSSDRLRLCSDKDEKKFLIECLDTRNTISIDMSILETLGSDEGRETVEEWVTQLKVGDILNIEADIREAMARVFGQESAELLRVEKRTPKYYSTLYPDAEISGHEWQLVDCRTLNNCVRRDENIEFLSLMGSVYLDGDNMAKGINRQGAFDPAVDCRMRTLVWINSKKSSRVENKYLVLVLKRAYIWRHQYLYEIENCDSSASARLNSLLYSKSLNSFQFKDFFWYHLTGWKETICSGSYAEPMTGETEEALCVHTESNGTVLVICGMGVVVHLSKDEMDEDIVIADCGFLAQASRSVQGRDVIEVAGIVKKIDRCSSANWNITIQLMVTNQWIPKKFFAGLYHQDCFSSNLEMKIFPTEIVQTLLISPAYLWSSASQCSNQYSAMPNELIVKGHLIFAEDVPKAMADCQCKRSDVGMCVQKLLEHRFLKKPNKATEWYRIKPLTPLECVNLLEWRVFSLPVPGAPTCERYRCELGQNFVNWAHRKTNRKSRTAPCSKHNTIPVSIPGRILLALVYRYVTADGGEMTVSKGGNYLDITVNDTRMLESLFSDCFGDVCECAKFDERDPNWSPQRAQTAYPYLITLSFNHLQSNGNCADGSLKIYSPISFRWQMYSEDSPVEIGDNSSEGTATMSCAYWEAYTISDTLMGYSVGSRRRKV